MTVLFNLVYLKYLRVAGVGLTSANTVKPRCQLFNFEAIELHSTSSVVPRTLSEHPFNYGLKLSKANITNQQNTTIKIKSYIRNQEMWKWRAPNNARDLLCQNTMIQRGVWFVAEQGDYLVSTDSYQKIGGLDVSQSLKNGLTIEIKKFCGFRLSIFPIPQVLILKIRHNRRVISWSGNDREPNIRNVC